MRHVQTHVWWTHVKMADLIDQWYKQTQNIIQTQRRHNHTDIHINIHTHTYNMTSTHGHDGESQ